MMVWALIEPNSFGMKFLLANPVLAAISLLPPIAGIQGAMISYIHKVGLFSDANCDPLIIDLDGDGIETRSMKDVGYRCRLPSGLLNRAANDNVVSKVWMVA
jgi:hypothetical protein